MTEQESYRKQKLDNRKEKINWNVKWGLRFVLKTFVFLVVILVAYSNRQFFIQGCHFFHSWSNTIQAIFWVAVFGAVILVVFNFFRSVILGRRLGETLRRLGNIFSALAPGIVAWLVLYGANKAFPYAVVSPPLKTGLISSMVLIGAVLATCIRVCICSRKKQQPVAHSNKAKAYFETLGKIDPIEMEDEDELKRAPIAKEIAELLFPPDNRCVTYGINGPWGSGKTSLLKLIKNHIEENTKFPKSVFVEFYSWHYREPDQLISQLFDTISDKLSAHCPSLRKTKRIMRRLAESISTSFEHSGFKVGLDWLHLLGSRRDEKDRLKTILTQELKSRLIIFIDDLDRLDRDEFFAVLRAIGLLSDLPKITFVLAYDKFYLKSQFFTNDVDPDNTIFVRYVGKIVQQEFFLSTPPDAVRKGIINNILDSVKKVISGDEYEKIVEFFNQDLIMSINFEMLQTPREIRQILASAIWRYSLPGVNSQHRCYFGDLFLLTLIEHKEPLVYKELVRSIPEIKSYLNKAFDIFPANGFDIEARNQDSETHLEKVKNNILKKKFA